MSFFHSCNYSLPLLIKARLPSACDWNTTWVSAWICASRIAILLIPNKLSLLLFWLFIFRLTRKTPTHSEKVILIHTPHAVIPILQKALWRLPGRWTLLKILPGVQSAGLNKQQRPALFTPGVRSTAIPWPRGHAARLPTNGTISSVRQHDPPVSTEGR